MTKFAKNTKHPILYVQCPVKCKMSLRSKFSKKIKINKHPILYVKCPVKYKMLLRNRTIRNPAI